MRKTLAFALLVIIGSATASEPWQAKSSSVSKQGTVTTELAGWRILHFPSTKPEFLMIGTDKLPIATITDYPDSVEVRTFNGNTEDFITVRDKDHDRIYEEIEGLKDGVLLKLDGATYKLTKVGDGWQLAPSQ